MTKPKQDQDSWEERMDKIFDKNTKALTKTHDDLVGDIISFDTIVVDAYESKKQILSLLLSQRQEILREVREMIKVRKNTESNLIDQQNRIWKMGYQEALEDISQLLSDMEGKDSNDN